jgi:Origin recognition complex (ORC) subunit 5 C-terminus
VRRACLQACNACQAYLGPLELRCSANQVLSHLVNGWLKAIGKPPVKLDGFSDAKAAIAKQLSCGRRLCIVADWEDATADREQLPVILELARQATRPLDVIIISPEPPISLFELKALPADLAWLRIPFPAYSQDEIISVLTAQRPADIPPTLYQSFLTRFIKPASHVKLSLSDARSMALKLRPHLRAAMATAGADAQPAQVLQQMQAGGPCKRATQCRLGSPLDISRMDWSRPPEEQACQAPQARRALSLDVPYLSKFLLLAAFLAGVNQPSADRTLFGPSGGVCKARRKDRQAMDRHAEAAKEQAASAGQVSALLMSGHGIATQLQPRPSRQACCAVCIVCALLMEICGLSWQVRPVPPDMLALASCRLSALSDGSRSSGS